MRRMVISLLAIFTSLLLLVSCSSSDSQITGPDDPGKVALNGNTSHNLWGLWEFVIDPEAQTLEYFELRVPGLHLNILPFMEPPPLVLLTLESEIFFDIPNNTLTVDIGLTHPFASLNEFAGFDVKGIVISRDDLLGAIPAAMLKMPGPTTLRLVNADGYSRMWNPDEFPYVLENELFCYKDGLLGAPDAYGQYDAQINGFKYFCDGLAPGDPPTAMNFDMRGIFGPGEKNIRTYTISTPQGLMFNYAVDVSWEFPNGPGPWIIPDDYPITANSPEAYIIDCMADGFMFSEDGGSNMNLTITVYDHQPGTIQDVFVEAKDLYYEVPPLHGLWIAAWQSSTTYTDIYTVHIDNINQVAAGIVPGLIHVVDTEINPYFASDIPPGHFTAYKVFDIPVTPKPSVLVTLEEDAFLKGAPGYVTVETFAYSTVHHDVPPSHIVDYTDADGPWEFSYVYTDLTIHQALPLTDPEVSGFVGLYPTEITHFWKDSFTFGPNIVLPYIGEQHHSATSMRLVYGITETVLINSTFIFTDELSQNVPMEFIYPYYYGTDFTAIGQYILPVPIPIEVFELNWRVRGIGEGDLTLTPGGTTYSALLMRHDIIIEMNDVAYAWAIIYEWYIDDGTPIAYITAGESPPHPSNFDHATGIIFGESDYMILEGY